VTTSPGLPPTTTHTPNGTTVSPTDPASELKAGILAGGWIPFVVVMGVALIFAFTFVRYYEHKHDRECGSTTVRYKQSGMERGKMVQ